MEKEPLQTTFSLKEEIAYRLVYQPMIRATSDQEKYPLTIGCRFSHIYLASLFRKKSGERP